MKNYALMLKTHDNNEFLKIYDEATKDLDQIILNQYYDEVQKKLTPGTEEYITAMECFAFLSVQDNHIV